MRHSDMSCHVLVLPLFLLYVVWPSERRRCPDRGPAPPASVGRWNLGKWQVCVPAWADGHRHPEGGGGLEEFAEATGETRLTGGMQSGMAER